MVSFIKEISVKKNVAGDIGILFVGESLFINRQEKKKFVTQPESFFPLQKPNERILYRVEKMERLRVLER